MMDVSEQYRNLRKELRRFGLLRATLEHLGWDEQVNLPDGAASFRGEQSAALAELLHKECTRPEVGALLEHLGSPDARPHLDDSECIVVREAQREYDRAMKLPPEFVQRCAQAHSEAYHCWKRAREVSDFSIFAPSLANNLLLAKEEAGYHGKSGADAYDYFIDLHDPGMDAGVITVLFDELCDELVPLVQRILHSETKANLTALKGFPAREQEAFLREVIGVIGFDANRGRLDQAVHPFCSGGPCDTRITTRYDPDKPLDSLFGALHEAGHALYQQGLPHEHFGTALCEPVGMAIHESQSRLWENQVGRSRAFWNYWEPRYRGSFPGLLNAVSSEELYLAINSVSITPIRVDADEVTYNLHILLRFEIEKGLFDGSLNVADLPEAWNAISKRILSFQPRDDREGLLQDVHWSGGAFGYFPSYCLGNMIAAHFWYVACDHLPDLEVQVAQGDYSSLLQWLRNHIHCHGKRFLTQELVQRVTGSGISPKWLIRYLTERYLPLYS